MSNNRGFPSHKARVFAIQDRSHRQRLEIARKPAQVNGQGLAPFATAPGTFPTANEVRDGKCVSVRVLQSQFFIQ